MEGKVFVAFFDAKMTTKDERANYRKFRKKLLGFGYSQVQESVYARFDDGSTKSFVESNKIRSIVPKTISLQFVKLTKSAYDNIVSINQNNLSFDFEVKTVIEI